MAIRKIEIQAGGHAKECVAHVDDKVKWHANITCCVTLDPKYFDVKDDGQFPLNKGETSKPYSFIRQPEHSWKARYDVDPGECREPIGGTPNDIIVDTSSPLPEDEKCPEAS